MSEKKLDGFALKAIGVGRIFIDMPQTSRPERCCYRDSIRKSTKKADKTRRSKRYAP